MAVLDDLNVSTIVRTMLHDGNVIPFGLMGDLND